MSQINDEIFMSNEIPDKILANITIPEEENNLDDVYEISDKTMSDLDLKFIYDTHMSSSSPVLTSTQVDTTPTHTTSNILSPSINHRDVISKEILPSPKPGPSHNIDSHPSSPIPGSSHNIDSHYSSPIPRPSHEI